jgi:hypothetical protein
MNGTKLGWSAFFAALIAASASAARPGVDWLPALVDVALGPGHTTDTSELPKPILSKTYPFFFFFGSKFETSEKKLRSWP